MDDFAHIVGEDVHFRGRSPSGERGLKCVGSLDRFGEHGRSPSGERGLKSLDLALVVRHPLVAPHPGSVD